MTLVLVCLILASGLAAFAAFWLGRRLRIRTGVPVRARVVSSDTGGWRQVEKPLFSRRYLLSGKPDYVVEADGARIPIEVKPNRVASEPYYSDVMQLAAYGMLIEETLNVRPPYGLVKYRDSVFRVEFTDELRQELLQVLNKMREDLISDDVMRSHADPRRCLACGYRGACGQNLDQPTTEEERGLG